jgi:hypothetical protein
VFDLAMGVGRVHALRESSPIRIRRASRRGRGGVFDLSLRVGRVHALIQTFFEGEAAAKGVAESRFEVSSFPLLPIPPSAPQRLCASPPHRTPKTINA